MLEVIAKFDNVGNCLYMFVMFYPLVLQLLTYLDTWSGFEAAKTAPWPSRGLHHCGKFLEPSDE